jgi:hypothetical protein
VPQSEYYCHKHYSLLKYFAWQAGIRISDFPVDHVKITNV